MISIKRACVFFSMIAVFSFVYGDNNKRVRCNCDEVLVASNVSLDKLKNFIKNNRVIEIEKKTEFLNTTKFEHSNNYFFNQDPPFVELDDGRYVIVYSDNPSAIYIYSHHGKFEKVISREGQGPGEILPGCIQIDKGKNRFYVSDETQAKIIVFNYNGEFVKEIKPSRKYAPCSFKVSTVSDKYFYYHIFPLPDAPMFTMGSPDMGIIKEFGSMNEVNIAASGIGGIKAMVFNEKGYLFVIKPEEYGYEIYNGKGNFVALINGKIPDYFDPVTLREVKRERKKVGVFKFVELFFNHTNAQRIYYLGNNIIVISYIKLCYKNSNKKIRVDDIIFKRGVNEDLTHKIFLEFWVANGEYLGAVRIDGRLLPSHGENGFLYCWDLHMQPDPNGFYPNPYLIKYDIWKEVGWR